MKLFIKFRKDVSEIDLIAKRSDGDVVQDKLFVRPGQSCDITDNTIFLYSENNTFQYKIREKKFKLVESKGEKE